MALFWNTTKILTFGKSHFTLASKNDYDIYIKPNPHNWNLNIDTIYTTDDNCTTNSKFILSCVCLFNGAYYELLSRSAVLKFGFPLWGNTNYEMNKNKYGWSQGLVVI